MDNNNNKKSSPLDEIKRITNEATKNRINTANRVNNDTTKQSTVKSDPLTNIAKPMETIRPIEPERPAGGA